MTSTASIAELQQAGVILEAGEAVAITLQLIQALRRDAGADVEPPYGPPTASNVILDADGSVTCDACGATPAISEIAIFLDALLPAGSSRVAGGLRYIIARGLLEVDVAPFDSLDDFAEALTRHERGPRREVLSRLLRRAESVCAFAHAERRRVRTTELRRALREADAQLYAHHVATTTVAPPVRMLAPAVRMLTPPARTRIVPAVAVCLGSGLVLIAGGELMQRRPAATPVATTPAVVPRVVSTLGTSAATAMAVPRLASERAASPRPIELPAAARAARQRAAAPARVAVATPPVRPVPLSPGEFGRADRRSVKPAARTSETGVRKVGSSRPSRGILDHLKFRWLRNALLTQS